VNSIPKPSIRCLWADWGVDIRRDRSKHLDAVVGKRMKHEAVIVKQVKDGAEILPEKNPASNQKYLSVSQVTLWRS